jgi:uncharacterized membrane protein
MQNPPPNQPDYGNQYSTPAPPVSTAVDESRAKTGLGLEANLGAALGYPVGLLAIVVFVMEKTNRFARFHALQSILFHVVMVVVFIVLGIVWVILALITALISSSLVTVVSILMWLVMMLVGLAYLGALIYFAIKAYSGSTFKLPIVGNMAEKILNK